MIKIENRIHLEAHKQENLFVHITCFDDAIDVRFTIGVSPRLNDTDSKAQLEEQAINTITLNAAEAFKVAEFLQGAASQASDVELRERQRQMENVVKLKKP